MYKVLNITLLVFFLSMLLAPHGTVLAISAPELQSPTCGIENAEFTGTQFTWTSVAGSDSYVMEYRKVIVKLDPSTGDPVLFPDSWIRLTERPEIPRITLPSPPLTSLQPNGKMYQWRVASSICTGEECILGPWGGNIGPGEDDWCSLITKTAGAPPPGGGGGDDDDDGGGGGGGGGGGDDSPLPGTGGIFQFKNPISSNTLPELINNLLNLIFGLSIVITPLVIVYAGFLMLTATGDAAKLQKARTILIWTVIAFAIILVAKGAPNVIRAIL